jgi:aquaporin Z
VHLRLWAAEAAGTALLVVGAMSAIAFVLGDGSPLDGLSESLGLLITGTLVGSIVALIVVSPLGRLSGAHLNPAITLAFSVTRMLCGWDVAGYIAAQLAGAVVGGFVFRWLWGSVALSVDGGVTHPAVGAGVAIGLEAAMTATLVAMILWFTSRERLMRWTPLMLVPVLAVLIWQGSPYTGTSLNPARSEGPAVAFADLADLWLYFAAPILGALAVAVAWRRAARMGQPKTAKLFDAARRPSSVP